MTYFSTVTALNTLNILMMMLMQMLNPKNVEIKHSTDQKSYKNHGK